MNQPEINKEAPKVSHEEVEALLRGQMTKEQMESAVPLDLPEDILEGTRGPTTTIPKNTPSEIKAQTSFDPDVPTSSAGLQWAVQTKDLKVEVDWEDKVAFAKAVATDSKFFLDIKNEAFDITIRVGSASQFEQDIAFAALRKDEDEKLITGPAEYATRAQQYLAALQIYKIGDVICDKRVVLDPEMDVKAAIEKLRNETRTYIGKINGPRWGLMLQALRIFELKHRICLERLNDRSFWKPADSA
jgi:hypothetical protein